MAVRLNNFKLVLTNIIILYNLIIPPNFARAEDIDSTIKSFIESYFHAQYQCLSDLKEREISEFYYLESSEGEKTYNIDKEVLSFIVECRAMQQNDLKLRSYKFELDYKEVKVLADRASIVLLENSEFQFKSLGNTTSRKHNIEHRFELKRYENTWKITGHDSNEDEFRIIKDGIREFRSYEGVKEFYLDMMRKNLDEKKESTRNRKLDEENLKKEKEDTIQSSGNKGVSKLNYYNREKAAAYAKQWSENGAKLRNSPPWANYDPQQGNGDCTNFVSQSVYSGGIHMDYRGKEYEQWKWYGNTYDPTPVAKGRVASWTGVQAFYSYCKLNKGFGMSAVVDAKWNEVHLGDVVQLGKSEDNYFHTVIITGYVYDENDMLVDFLICSHTTDRNNYPLSAYNYPLKRYIHIKGWSN